MHVTMGMVSLHAFKGSEMYPFIPAMCNCFVCLAWRIQLFESKFIQNIAT